MTNAEVAAAKLRWQRAAQELRLAQDKHRDAPVPANWKALSDAANEWQMASATWLNMIKSNGNARSERTEHAAATRVRQRRYRAT